MDPNKQECIQECGIGWQSSEDSPGRAGSPDMALGGTGAGHRVLVFAQLKGMLDLVEADVLRPGGISFLRLDGRLIVLMSGCCSYAPLHLQRKLMQGESGEFALSLGVLHAFIHLFCMQTG